MKLPIFLILLGLMLPLTAEMRVWRAVGGFRTEAEFISYVDGWVTLKRKDGREVRVRVERLSPRDREEVQKLAGDDATGFLKTETETRKAPSGRRDLVWKELNRGDFWPKKIHERELKALKELSTRWRHAETEHFIIHYEQLGYAKRVARQADFFYEYIAYDLNGMKELATEKSHIVVIKDRDDWKEFLKLSQVAPEWAGAYVRGQVMFVMDTDDNERNANTLAHETSHLVLNRFFRSRPPLWLNEGMAEWYERNGWKAFKGQHVNVEKGLGELKNPYPVPKLMDSGAYPAKNEVNRFYLTSRELLGFIKLQKDQKAFVEFLSMITVQGKSQEQALSKVYGYNSIRELDAAFQEHID